MAAGAAGAAVALPDEAAEASAVSFFEQPRASADSANTRPADSKLRRFKTSPIEQTQMK
jgi:hypothetical protein